MRDSWTRSPRRAASFDPDASADAPAADAGDDASRLDCFSWSTGGAGGTWRTFSRKTATPTTPTLSGRPVRAAYELDSAVNSKAATRDMSLRQPAICADCPLDNT